LGIINLNKDLIMKNLQQGNYSMNDEIEKYPHTRINNKIIEAFNELDVLGLYTYLRMLLDHEATTVTVIIDRIIEKFKVDYGFVMFVLKQLEKEGLLFIARKPD